MKYYTEAEMRNNATKIWYLLLLIAIFVSFSVIQGQNTTTSPSTTTTRGNLTLKAELVNEKEETAKKMATVRVNVQGVTLQDPMTMPDHQMGSGGGNGHSGMENTPATSGTASNTGKDADERTVANTGSRQEDQNTGGTKATNPYQPTQTGSTENTGSTSNVQRGTAVTAHLHYQLGSGPDIATATTVLTCANLSSGKHTIHVKVVDSNHRPLGVSDTVTVTIP